MKTSLTSFTPAFNASAKTLTFTGMTGFDLRRLLAVLNHTTRRPLFEVGTAGLGGTLAGSVLTLDCDTTGMSNTDVLMVDYDEASSDTALLAISNRLPAALGAAHTAASLPCVLADDQIAVDVSNPSVVVPATTFNITTAGTGAANSVTAQVCPGGTYALCIQTPNLTTSAVTSASCTTVVGSTTVTTANTSVLHVGTQIFGTGIPCGAYVVSINAGVSFVMSLPATAAGTVTITGIAGYFTCNFEMSSDGTNFTPATVYPQAPTPLKAPVTSTNTIGLWTWQAPAGQQWIRIRFASATNTPSINGFIDAVTAGGQIHIPYMSGATAVLPSGATMIPPIDASFISEVIIDMTAFGATNSGQGIFTFQSGDPNINGSNVAPLSSDGITPATVANINSAGTYRSTVATGYWFAKYVYTTMTSNTVGQMTARVGYPQNMIGNVSVGGLPTINLTQLSGASAACPNANGSAGKLLGVTLGTAVANTDANAIAFAGSGRVNGTVVASAGGSGVCIAADLNPTVTTLGTATALLFVLQEAFDAGVTFTDIWTSLPFTATGHYRVPAVQVGGRRRWSMMSVGGTSTTVPATITAQELAAVYPGVMQFVDIYAATNPTASIINGTTYASTLVSTTLSSTSGVAALRGYKTVTIAGLFTGGTPTTAPVYALQVSNDLANWKTTTCTISPTTAGYFTSDITLTGSYQYARLIVTTASAGGTPYGVTYTAINAAQ